MSLQGFNGFWDCVLLKPGLRQSLRPGPGQQAGQVGHSAGDLVK